MDTNLQLPICSFDAKTGILCPKCETKLKNNHITKSDVNISKKLSKLVDKIHELDKTTLIHGMEVEGGTVLVMSNGSHDKLRKNQLLFRQLENELKSKLWITDIKTSNRQVLENIFFPAKILTINVVWLPDGSKLTKVIVPGRKTKRFPLNLKHVKKVVKAVIGIELLIEFERT